MEGSRPATSNGRSLNHARFKDKVVTVFGLHVSGVSVSKLLDSLGANVRVTDSKPANQLQAEVDALNNRAIQFFLGGHDCRCIENADLIVLSPGVPLDIPILKEARLRSIPIVGELEIAVGMCPAPIVAITGTKGKSTTALIIGEILKRSRIFRRVWVSGNIGVPFSSDVGGVTEADLVVLEVSSFQLETTETLRPMVSVVLNLSPDHLDRHETMEAYRNAKLRICTNQKPADWIVLNSDDSMVSSFAKETQARAVWFSENSHSAHIDVSAINRLSEDGRAIVNRAKDIVVQWDDRPHWICSASDIPLPGRHNARNVLAAAAVAKIFGVSSELIRSAIVEFRTKEHRALDHAFDVLKTVGGVEFIDDSKATNVHAVKSAIESLSVPLILIMGGYDKGNDYGPLIDLVKTKVKGLVLLGAHTEIIRNVLGPYVVTWNVADMGEAVEMAYSHAVPGDVVLLSPANASFDMFDDYRARGCAFQEAVNHLEAMDGLDKGPSSQ